jgi:hypothetical protein
METKTVTVHYFKKDSNPNVDPGTSRTCITWPIGVLQYRSESPIANGVIHQYNNIPSGTEVDLNLPDGVSLVNVEPGEGAVVEAYKVGVYDKVRLSIISDALIKVVWE